MKAVLDTSTVLSALLFPHGKLTWIRNAWQTGLITPLVCSPTAKELMRVLTYPRFKLDAEEIELLLSDYLPYTTIIKISAANSTLPRCRDKNDQIFLDLALTGKAKFLVSSDKDLLCLKGKTPFEIVTAKEFKDITIFFIK